MLERRPLRPPLLGIRVLDLTRLLPGDFATWVLADLGAEVIKVEDTAGGDYMRWMPPMTGENSAMYWSLNRGKRCIKLDLKQERGRDVFLRLIDGADCVVEGFRPGVMARLGLGYEDLKKRKPDIIYCAITGYGQDGPYEQRAGHDLLYNSLAGLQGVTGTADGELVIPGFQVADLGAGGLGGALAILSALLRRERDPGHPGAFLDVSMFDGVAAFIAPHMARHLAGGSDEGPGRMQLNGRYPCYRLYRAGDGRWMALAALEPKFWKAFCELVDRPDLVERQFDEDGTAGEVAAIIGSRTRAEWELALKDADVMMEPVNNLGEAARDPQMLARGLQIEVPDAIPQPAPVVRLEDGFHADTRVADYGADTDAVLAEAGYSAEEVAGFHEAGVI
jgi:crotonobetainyl-CoA:carnitine CoA-transferase CaiB-like acyl-CoA transferase